MALKQLYSGVEPKLCSSPDLVPGVKVYRHLSTVGDASKQSILCVGGRGAKMQIWSKVYPKKSTSMTSLPFLAQVSLFENNFLPSTRGGFELLTFGA